MSVGKGLCDRERRQRRMTSVREGGTKRGLMRMHGCWMKATVRGLLQLQLNLLVLVLLVLLLQPQGSC